MNRRIDEFLGASLHAKQLSHLSMGTGRELAIWENDNDVVQYSATRGHAFSLYLSGGHGTCRIDGSTKTGAPGMFCMFPEGHSSVWKITEPFQFMHFYVADDLLRGAFSRIHDKDARRMALAEQTLVAPGELELPLRQMARATLLQDHLGADIAFSNLVAALAEQPVILSGGLSPKHLRNVTEWSDAHLHTSICLSDLANVVGLSEYHFHRMFRKSCGISPHSWLTQARINRAKSLMKTTPMAQIGLLCGFSSQSHFIRQFKSHTGMTPGQYFKSLERSRVVIRL